MVARSQAFVRRLRRAVIRGSLPVWILEELETGPTYGYQLLQRLGERHGGSDALGPSTVYPALARLRFAGLVHVFHGKESQGPLRKYYELTPEGQAVLPGIRHLGLSMAATLARPATPDRAAPRSGDA
jgi:PadR family transcriptional regulator PadR